MTTQKIRLAQSSFYPERSNDGISAIALRFVEQLPEHNAQFIDLETIMRAIRAQHVVVEAINALVAQPQSSRIIQAEILEHA